jgi:hypothetical protein
MTYIIDCRYSSIGTTFETLDQAREKAAEYAQDGDSRYLLIAELVEIHKVTVPVEVAVVNKDDIQNYISSLPKNKNSEINGLPDTIQV